ncbi:TfuA-like protein [Kitasatospora sp. NPDC057541]|uniref:TfuA-like protein n=1 Tax=unclassified Kitasatospora TaxID=2633591 RepID=UPI00369E5D68
MTVIVFLGPSLPLDEARGILPDAVFFPPAKQADIATVLTVHDPDVIALVDGEFHQARSVWHKEVLLALQRGVRVYGASSMGALRAAELEAFGMRGRGEVFARYASGEIIDDDEVALTYAFEDGRYIKLSEPMVNIRATVEAAQARGVISAETARLAVDTAKGLHYRDRSRARIAAMLRTSGAEEARRLDVFWRENLVDVKADDARALFGELADRRRPADDTVVPWTLAPTASLDTLYNRERQVEFDGVRIALSDVADHVQLHHPGAGRLNEDALNRAVALVLARLLHVTPSEREIDEEASRWAARHGYEDEAAFAGWLSRNQVTPEEFRGLAREAAQCRALHRWLLYAHHTERSAKPLLDHLRWNDEFEKWGRGAALAAEAARESGVEPAEVAARSGPRQLRGEHEAWTGRRSEAGYAVWAEEAGFNSVQDLTHALARAGSTRIGLLEALRRIVPET